MKDIKNFINGLSRIEHELGKYNYKNAKDFAEFLQVTFLSCIDSYIDQKHKWKHILKYEEPFEKLIISPKFELTLIWDIGLIIKQWDSIPFEKICIDPTKIDSLAIDINENISHIKWDEKAKPRYNPIAVYFPVGNNELLLIDGIHRINAARNSCHEKIEISICPPEISLQFLEGDFQRKYMVLAYRLKALEQVQQLKGNPPAYINLEEERYFFGL